MQLGMLSSSNDAMSGVETASPPAPRALRAYVCKLANHGMLYGYLKRAMNQKSDNMDPGAEKVSTLLCSKAHLEKPFGQGTSLENDINQIYLRQDLLTLSHPNLQLIQPGTSNPFLANKKRKSLLPEPTGDYLKTKFHSTGSS